MGDPSRGTLHYDSLFIRESNMESLTQNFVDRPCAMRARTAASSTPESAVALTWCNKPYVVLG